MKKILLFALLFISMTARSQDYIITRDGDTLRIQIVKNAEDAVEFLYPNESAINEIGKKSIAKIIFNSGREEVCNTNFEIPTIEGEKDWEKVVITYLESDVKGLKRVQELKATSGWGGSLASGLGYKKAIKALKKKAAKLKAPVVLITGRPNEYAEARGGNVQVLGVAYK
jgi:hypothetical protein